LGLVDEHFVICPWHQRRQDHRRYWRSQRRDSRVCHGPGRLESDTNTYLNAYIYLNPNSDTYVHSYSYSYNYTYVYGYADCDGNSKRNAYSNSYTQAVSNTANCSYTATAPDCATSPVAQQRNALAEDNAFHLDQDAGYSDATKLVSIGVHLWLAYS